MRSRARDWRTRDWLQRLWPQKRRNQDRPLPILTRRPLLVAPPALEGPGQTVEPACDRRPPQPDRPRRSHPQRPGRQPPPRSALCSPPAPPARVRLVPRCGRAPGHDHLPAVAAPARPQPPPTVPPPCSRLGSGRGRGRLRRPPTGGGAPLRSGRRPGRPPQQQRHGQPNVALQLRLPQKRQGDPGGGWKVHPALQTGHAPWTGPVQTLGQPPPSHQPQMMMRQARERARHRPLPRHHPHPWRPLRQRQPLPKGARPALHLEWLPPPSRARSWSETARQHLPSHPSLADRQTAHAPRPPRAGAVGTGATATRVG